VLALDASNRTVTGYSGTVHFTSSDPQAVLSGDSTLTNGAGTFSASLAGPGSETITATDTITAKITGSSNSIEVATNSNVHGFQATGDMGTERAAHTATLLANGKVLVAGGFNSTDNLATAELFDPATGTFTAAGAMTELRSQHTATLLTNGKVLLAGGTVDNAAELFDPATGSFALTGAMITGDLMAPTATLLNDGTVLITGGFNFDDGTFASAELYNPATGTFTATGDMTQPRANHTATLLDNGKVLVTGGFDAQAHTVATAELFDPATGSFSTTGAPISVHTYHAATLLNDGIALVVGGFLFPNPPPVTAAQLPKYSIPQPINLP